MELEQIKIWCEENNYALVQKRKKHLEINEVIAISENVVGLCVAESMLKLQQQDISFSRYLAITYLYDFYAPAILARRFNVNHTIISYAIKRNLFDENEITYLKRWQQEAVKEFINQIRLQGGDVRQPKLRRVGAREKY